MVNHEPEHLAMADMLWNVLLKMNMADPKETRDRALSLYSSDNSGLVREGKVSEYTPYAHVQEALNYALLNLTDGNQDRAERLRYLLTDNTESVTYNLEILREDEQNEAAHRLTELVERYEY